MRSKANQAQLWEKTKKRWFEANPSDFYTCYLCGKYLRNPSYDSMHEVATLDHVIPRSGDPSLRHELSNLKPACYRCNMGKGSKRLD